MPHATGGGFILPDAESTFPAASQKDKAHFGFIVLMLDGRGTPGRGRDFREVYYGNIGRHEIPEHASALQQLARTRHYMDLRGVGHWTAQWVLVRALGRPDAFPSGDLALQRAISNLYFNRDKLTAEQIEEFSQRWSPFRTYATIYMFTALRAGMA